MFCFIDWPREFQKFFTLCSHASASDFNIGVIFQNSPSKPPHSPLIAALSVFPGFCYLLSDFLSHWVFSASASERTDTLTWMFQRHFKCNKSNQEIISPYPQPPTMSFIVSGKGFILLSVIHARDGAFLIPLPPSNVREPPSPSLVIPPPKRLRVLDTFLRTHWHFSRGGHCHLSWVTTVISEPGILPSPAHLHPTSAWSDLSKMPFHVLSFTIGMTPNGCFFIELETHQFPATLSDLIPCFSVHWHRCSHFPTPAWVPICVTLSVLSRPSCRWLVFPWKLSSVTTCLQWLTNVPLDSLMQSWLNPPICLPCAALATLLTLLLVWKNIFKSSGRDSLTLEFENVINNMKCKIFSTCRRMFDLM